MKKMILILLGLGLVTFAFAEPNFLKELNETNQHAEASVKVNISIWGKLLFGLLPVVTVGAITFLVHRYAKKNLIQEDDSKFKLLFIDLGTVFGSVFVGLIIVYLLGAWLFIMHGGGETGLNVFSLFWYELLVTPVT